MTRESILKMTIDSISKLPDQKIKEVADFADFLLSRLESQLVTQGIQELASQSRAFDFLKEEEDLYSVKDLKERYK